jgi:hypothetical protein
MPKCVSKREKAVPLPVFSPQANLALFLETVITLFNYWAVRRILLICFASSFPFSFSVTQCSKLNTMFM